MKKGFDKTREDTGTVLRREDDYLRLLYLINRRECPPVLHFLNYEIHNYDDIKVTMW